MFKLPLAGLLVSLALPFVAQSANDQADYPLSRPNYIRVVINGDKAFYLTGKQVDAFLTCHDHGNELEACLRIALTIDE